MIITSLAKATKLIKSPNTPIRALLSIGDPGSKLPYGFSNVTHRTRIEFDDVTELYANVNNPPPKWLVTLQGPTVTEIKQIVDFAERNKRYAPASDDNKNSILIHCFAGHSRSTAAGYIIHSFWGGKGMEATAMHATLQACTELDVCPNKLMVEIADRYLERDGALISMWHDFFSSRKGSY